MWPGINKLSKNILSYFVLIFSISFKIDVILESCEDNLLSALTPNFSSPSIFDILRLILGRELITFVLFSCIVFILSLNNSIFWVNSLV